jgi:hypothetical protein
MRHIHLRRLFVSLAAVASPLPIVTVGCAGTAVDSSEGRAGTAGDHPVFMGVGDSGTFTPGNGGSGGAGGYPVYVGTGGVRGTPIDAPDAVAPLVDGSPQVAVDSGTDGAVSPCAPGKGGGGPCASAYCVPLVSADSGGSASCAHYCGQNGQPPALGCESVEWQGVRQIKCYPDCTGRRPAGLEGMPPCRGGALRRYFEEMSRLEAASIPAFRTLARELSLHGAPRSLRRAARRAARDEVRHTRLGTELAERFGGSYQRPRIAPTPPRSLEALATDNAVEGCVRETFGAMMATWQSRAASDPVVRRIMRRVAVDETRHAALAVRVAKWAERKLDDRARARVVAARRDAAAVVLSELALEPPPELAIQAGVPSRADAQRLAQELYERLWA